MGFVHSDFLKAFKTPFGEAKYYSLPELEARGYGSIATLPVSLRIVLESVLRNFNGLSITEDHVKALASWQSNGERTEEVPFKVARVLLQDFTGVPLGVDLAAMRTKVAQLGKDPAVIEPLVPVDLVIDHSVQVDVAGQSDALQKNLDIEFQRNEQRYQFLKWCMETFESFKVVPPGIGICHQVNLEYLAQGVLSHGEVYYPDSVVGTDSHTTMINGLGVVGWGVGGIEAEAGMLGQPVYFLTPDVVGVNLKGSLTPGVTATDLVLAITELLRKTKVVGKFVEFHGEGAASLNVVDRATIANMAPEYGATMGFFPIDEKTCEYLLATGRSKEHVETFKNYYTAQGLFGMPKAQQCRYSQFVEFDLSQVVPSIAGPKRPQDRIALSEAKNAFLSALSKPIVDNGFGKTATQAEEVFTSSKDSSLKLKHGDVVIAAITSCTNTSNPSAMLSAGILAKKAVERGLTVKTHVKTSLAPGSRIASEYLSVTGLQQYLDQLGFQIVGFGCTTCIGNSGPLEHNIDQLITKEDIVAASVLSGNRNFEARVHQNVKANFLMSPALVVAYALTGTILKDLTTEPLGKDKEGKDVYLKDIWPTSDELDALMGTAFNPESYKKNYKDFENQSAQWKNIAAPKGVTYAWDSNSTYIQEPPYFKDFTLAEGAFSPIQKARALAIFGDSVTTDHISPAGGIKEKSPAGRYLLSKGVAKDDFNSYGARRGNHEVMMRGTFANVRIKNLMVPGVEGGVTKHYPSGEQMDIFDAAVRYQSENIPLIVIAGQEYGTGSSRDWAAKGPRLQGVKAVIAQSFERIHRSNLVGMGVLPCQFEEGTTAQTLSLTGEETFSLEEVEKGLSPRQSITLTITRKDGQVVQVPVKVRLDTPIEVEYYAHGGILQYVLKGILTS